MGGSGTTTAAALLEATRTVPIVFAIVVDPVGAGFVREPGAAGRQCHRFPVVRDRPARKWLELLREIAPRATRAAVLRNPAIASGIGQFAALQAVAPSLGVELSPSTRAMRSKSSALSRHLRVSNGGLIVPASLVATRHRDLDRHACGLANPPAVYFVRFFVAAGGLISYGPDLPTSSASRRLIDRILKGE